MENNERMDRMEKNIEFLVDVVKNNMATKIDIASIESRMATKEDIASIESRMVTKEDIANMATHDDIALIVANMASKEDIEMLHHEIVGKTNSAHTRIDQGVDKHNQLEVRVARLETISLSHQ